MMQGILIVDKPMDWTSFDVVAKLRGVLGTRKLGHSGTLDPMATGVLPVFCGGASKAVDLQLNHDKTYRATLRLGARTDTGDSTGTVPSVNHVSMRMNATCLSAWCTSAAIASMASRSSASSGLTIQAGPCIERR